MSIRAFFWYHYDESFIAHILIHTHYSIGLKPKMHNLIEMRNSAKLQLVQLIIPLVQSKSFSYIICPMKLNCIMLCRWNVVSKLVSLFLHIMQPSKSLGFDDMMQQASVDEAPQVQLCDRPRPCDSLHSSRDLSLYFMLSPFFRLRPIVWWGHKVLRR